MLPRSRDEDRTAVRGGGVPREACPPPPRAPSQQDSITVDYQAVLNTATIIRTSNGPAPAGNRRRCPQRASVWQRYTEMHMAIGLPVAETRSGTVTLFCRFVCTLLIWSFKDPNTAVPCMRGCSSVVKGYGPRP